MIYTVRIAKFLLLFSLTSIQMFSHPDTLKLYLPDFSNLIDFVYNIHRNTTDNCWRVFVYEGVYMQTNIDKRFSLKSNFCYTSESGEEQHKTRNFTKSSPNLLCVYMQTNIDKRFSLKSNFCYTSESGEEHHKTRNFTKSSWCLRREQMLM